MSKSGKGLSKSFADGIAAIGAAAGAAVANATKKKKPTTATKKKKKGGKGAIGSYSMPARMSLVSAPVQTGLIMRRSGLGHTPFVVSGTTAGPTPTYISGTNCVLYNSVDTASTVNNFNVDPLGSAAIAANFRWQQASVLYLGYCFTRYRLRKFVIHYNPLVPTSTPGSIAIGAVPEVNTGAGISQIAYNDVSSFECSVVTPPWQPVSFDAMARGGLTSDWKYLDTTVILSQAEARQEAPGNVAVAFRGTTPTAGTYFGVLTIDFSIEFDGFANEANFQLGRKVQLDQSSSSPPPPPPSVASPSTVRKVCETCIDEPCYEHVRRP